MSQHDVPAVPSKQNSGHFGVIVRDDPFCRFMNHCIINLQQDNGRFRKVPVFEVRRRPESCDKE
jgi:hypothetical protein